MSIVNDHLVLVSGESSTGKSACLRNLKNVLYLNCESGKKLPYKPEKHLQKIITDPHQVYEWFKWAENVPEIEYIVVDGLNFLMDMYESTYVLTSSNTMKAWGNYAQYFKNLMQQYVAPSSKAIIFTAHTRQTINDTSMVLETKVPIKGALANQGLEAYFSTIISTKKVKMGDLEGIENDLLNITEREKNLGYKHVFQTNVTSNTISERMRSAMGLFADNEVYIDNDIGNVIQRLHEFYDE